MEIQCRQRRSRGLFNSIMVSAVGLSPHRYRFESYLNSKIFKTMKQNERRRSALERLQSQLKSGVKTVKGTVDQTEILTEKDVKRINREIEVLKSKLT